MLKLLGLTSAAIFTAEALIMLFLEFLGERLSLPLRILLDSSLLLVCVVPTLYFLVFKEMAEQIRLRRQAEEAHKAWSQSLELLVEERAGRLQLANEDLLVEVQTRAKAAMTFRTALNEVRQSKEQLLAVINAVQSALLVVDQRWSVQFANQAAESVFGMSAYDLQGKSVQDLLLTRTGGPVDPESDFPHQGAGKRQLMTCRAAEKNPAAVEMQRGAELQWQGQPATVLIVSRREEHRDDVTKPSS